MNQILGFIALENIENYNNKERDRSFGKGSLQKEITGNNNIKRNKNKSLILMNKKYYIEIFFR